MNRVKATLLVGPAVLALALSGCSGAGGAPDPVGQGTGAANTSQPQAAAPPTEVSTPAPEGGAAVRLGDTEEAITTVGCTEINDTWTVSGSNEGGAKAAVTTSQDRQTVIDASVVLADGKIGTMKEGEGSATIAWEGETFTVSGTGTFLDLGSGKTESSEQIGFLITGTCAA